MTDLRLMRIIEECDDGIFQISEALKDIKAGTLSDADANKIRRIAARVPVIEQQLAEIEKEPNS